MKLFRFKEAIKNFRDKHILVVGDLILDKNIYGEAKKTLSPEAPIIVLQEKNNSLDYRLGGAANVANNIVSLGGNATLLGVVGNDEPGRIVKETANKKGIDTQGIITDSSRPTTIKTRIFAQYSYHPKTLVLRLDREECHDINYKIVKELTTIVENNKHEYDAIIFSDYNKGTLTPELIKDLKTVLKDVPSLVDTKAKKSMLFKGCHWFTPNKDEAQDIVGFAYKNIEDKVNIKKLGDALLKKLDPKNILMTIGGEGMILFSKDKEYEHIPTITKDVSDVTGAGDTVISALSLSLASGISPKESAIISNFAAGVVVSKIGTSTVTPEELIRSYINLNNLQPKSEF